MLTPEIRRCIKGAVACALLADEASEDGNTKKAAHYDAVFEGYAGRLGDETLELIRARKAELAR